MLVSVLLGTILAAVAAVLPSYKAARLAPMEAMRVE
jgi:ABC-type antimicrobial peptide transport system permease subunit